MSGFTGLGNSIGGNAQNVLNGLGTTSSGIVGSIQDQNIQGAIGNAFGGVGGLVGG